MKNVIHVCFVISLFSINLFGQTTTLINQGSTWHYFNQGLLPAANWMQGAFSVNTWQQAPAEFGFGDSDETTILSFGSDPNNKYITAYFRKDVNITLAGSLNASVKVDDATVVYFNGTEVFRHNLPVYPSAIGYSTLGISPTANENTWHDFTIPSNLIVVGGNNTIAVEMHQAEITSSDMSFDFKLLSTQPNCASTIINLNESICSGQVYDFYGQNLTQSGNYSRSTSDTTRTKTSTVPIGAIRWDGYHPIIYDQSIPDTYNDIASKVASGFSMVPEYRKYAPFHSYNVPQVNFNMNYYANNTWNFEPRYYDMDFQGNEQWVMDAELDYAVESGIDYFLFLFYANGSPLSYGRQLYTSTPNKKGIKMAYALHNLGGGSDRVLAIQTIVSAMSQTWYQKIDGKPILFVNNDNIQDLIDVRTAYGSNEIYVVYQLIYPEADPGIHVPIINNNGMNAIGRYSSFGNNSDHLYSNISTNDVMQVNQFLPTNVDIVPLVTTSFFNKAMRTHSISSPMDPGAANQFNFVATNQELTNHLQEMVDLCALHPTRIKTMICYAWNEHYEGGKVICPSKNIDGTINTEVIEVFNSVLYDTQICDSTFNLNLTVGSIVATITQTNNSLQANNVAGATYQWYDCNTNLAIPGATGIIFNPIQSGSYRVAINAGNNCSATSTCSNLILNLNQKQSEQISAYPNPTNGEIEVQVSHEMVGSKIMILDISGKIIYSKNIDNENSKVDLSSQADGIYFIHLENLTPLKCIKQ